MRIIVCTKFIQGELNPFDASALECALELAETLKKTQTLKKTGTPGQETPGKSENLETVGTAAELFLLGMGPLTWMEPMRKLTRLGNSVKLRAVLLSDADFAGSDTLATSRILAAAVRKIEKEYGPADWIFCGRQTIDGDTAQVGPELAALLKIGLAANCLEFPSGIGKQTLRTRTGTEIVQAPAVLTLERIRELRFPSLRSRAGNVEVLSRAELGIPAEFCGTAGSPTRVLQTFTAERGRRKCRWIQLEELLPLLETLRDQPARLGRQISGSRAAEMDGGTGSERRESTKLANDAESGPANGVPGPKLSKVFAVGHEVESAAREIAEEVIFVEKTDLHTIAEAVRDADVVLWNADLWGRKTAPQTAALLGTGLCADCTELETDGETLFFYRPARSGDVLAKIVCRTRPQMGTVRTADADSGDLILAGGRGIAGNWETLKKLAKKWNAQPAASRALVDSDGVPYEYQIGLTGRNVSPKIYVAVGISGAVQHMCAIESADVILAVNPDRNARIFEFADYGIEAHAEDFWNFAEK